MKKIIAITAFVMITIPALLATTGCGPGYKTTNPDNTTDSLSTRNTNGGMDSTVISDTGHIRNKGR